MFKAGLLLGAFVLFPSLPILESALLSSEYLFVDNRIEMPRVVSISDGETEFQINQANDGDDRGTHAGARAEDETIQRVLSALCCDASNETNYVFENGMSFEKNIEIEFRVMIEVNGKKWQVNFEKTMLPHGKILEFKLNKNSLVLPTGWQNQIEASYRPDGPFEIICFCSGQNGYIKCLR